MKFFIYLLQRVWKKGRKRRIPFVLSFSSARIVALASSSSSSLVVVGTREHLRGFPFPLRFPLRCSHRSLLHLPPNSCALFSPPFFPDFFLTFSLVCLTTKIPAACSVSSCPFSPSLLLLLLLLLFRLLCFHAGFVKTGLGTIIVLFVFACLLASTEICRLANLEGANWREIRTSERGFYLLIYFFFPLFFFVFHGFGVVCVWSL